jgi:imidazole glycerol-phosphate synthase subunit HisH
LIAVIKYNAGNIKSVLNCLNRLNTEAIYTDDATIIEKADKVIFPGVGEAGSAMKYLRDKQLTDTIKNLTQPFLGICLGLQLMCKHSEEGNTECLGIFNTTVKRFPNKEKIPHMGWNNIHFTSGKLFNGITKSDNVYFVHSYYAAISSETIAQTNYIKNFSSAIHKNNFYAVQFHPEKSAAVGERIMKNFLEL